MSGLRPAEDSDPIHFCTFKLGWNNSKWGFSLDEIVSTDLAGIAKMISGALPSAYPSLSTFKESVVRKGLKDGVLK